MHCPVIYDPETKIWSNPFKIPPVKMCLGQKILNKLNENDPNKIIEVNYDNGEKLTSNHLKTLLITAAQNLLNMGIKKGDIVLFFSSMNSLTTPIVFACFTIGAQICPMELTLGDDDSAAVVNKINPTIILYDEIFENRVKSIIENVKLSNLKYVLSFESKKDGKSVPQMLCSPIESIYDFDIPDLGDPDAVIGGLLLTSGTTGLPKAVCLSHSQIILGTHDWWPTNSNSVIYVASPLRWISQVSIMLVPIISGGCRAFSGQSPTPEICLSLIKKCGVTNMFAVVGLIINIFRAAEKKSDDLKTLRYVLTGGERISNSINELVRNLTPDCIFAKGYGMTELAGCISSTAFENIANDIECGSGYIRQGFSIKIVDNNNKSLGPNQNGQIYIKRIAPHLKYYKNDNANSESYSSDSEWFLSGDYGKFDDNKFIHVFNRCKDLVSYGEYIIIPSILEKHLETYKDLQASYIVGIPDSNKGEIPVAFIKFNSNISTDRKSQDDLKNDINIFLKSNLPSDQLPPEKIYFMDTFPYTSCGKVDKMKLKEWTKVNPTQ